MLLYIHLYSILCLIPLPNYIACIIKICLEAIIFFNIVSIEMFGSVNNFLMQLVS